MWYFARCNKSPLYDEITAHMHPHPCIQDIVDTMEFEYLQAMR